MTKEKPKRKLIYAKTGVLNENQLLLLNRWGFIENMSEESIDGSAIDLHLSDEAWKIDCTSKLKSSQRVRDLLKEPQLNAKQINLEDEILDKKNIYIIRLEEKVSFNEFEHSDGLYGRASGKSTIGRLDILTRLLVDYCPKYDEIPPVYNGELFLEVIPISFRIKVNKGVKLHQLRVFKGKPELSLIPLDKLSELSPLLYYEYNKPVEPRDGILRVNLKNDENGNIAFATKDTGELLDLTRNPNELKYNSKEFWEEIKGTEDLRMVQERFYILRSKERLLLPNNVAVSCIAYTENLGELRIHYAGFAHPNFGRRRPDNKIGAPLIFEARCHSFGVIIKDEEQFAKIEFYRMSQPSNKTSDYTGQELKLSNYFNN